MKLCPQSQEHWVNPPVLSDQYPRQELAGKFQILNGGKWNPGTRDIGFCQLPPLYLFTPPPRMTELPL